MACKAYKFRLRPNVAQRKAFEYTLELCQQLYNGGLEERITAYKRQKISLSNFAQSAELTDLKKECPEYTIVYTQVLQDVLKRLQHAFDGFFHRVKQGKTPGFPRFKSKDRYDSFTFPQIFRTKTNTILKSGGVGKLPNSRLKVSGIPGDLKVIWHREMLGIPKTATFKREGKNWYIIFVCENVPIEEREPSGKSCALDLGIEAFATLDDGTRIPNNRFLASAKKKITDSQRKMARRKRGSNRRKKAKELFAKHHKHVANARKDFHHKTARTLINKFDKIAVEKLNIIGLTKGILAKSVNDVGWGQFLSILSSKAEGAGCKIVEVNPNGTSQECSSCGREVKKKLSERIHRCPYCQYEAHRDINAALNIYQRAFGKNK